MLPWEYGKWQIRCTRIPSGDGYLSFVIFLPEGEAASMEGEYVQIFVGRKRVQSQLSPAVLHLFIDGKGA